MSVKRSASRRIFRRRPRISTARCGLPVIKYIAASARWPAGPASGAVAAVSTASAASELRKGASSVGVARRTLDGFYRPVLKAACQTRLERPICSRRRVELVQGDDEGSEAGRDVVAGARPRPQSPPPPPAASPPAPTAANRAAQTFLMPHPPAPALEPSPKRQSSNPRTARGALRLRRAPPRSSGRRHSSPAARRRGSRDVVVVSPRAVS